MKKSCPKSESINFRFKCPFDNPECDKCTMFGGSAPVETFVKIPEKPGQTDAESMTREQCETITGLIIEGHNFEETGNQAYAMRAIEEALEVGLYPPQWALNAIRDVFSKFLKREGRSSIADLFGCGPGKNLVKEMFNRDKRESVLQRINREYAKNSNLEKAVATIEDQNGQAPGTYSHWAKDSLPPSVKLNRAFSKSKKKNPPK